MKSVVVADIPVFDGTPINAEIVSFLAAKEIFETSLRSLKGLDTTPLHKIAVGSGYTTRRILSLGMNYYNFENTLLIPLMSFKEEWKNRYTANYNALMMKYRHQLADALWLPHKSIPDAMEQWETVEGRLREDTTTAILTVNGVGARMQGGLEYTSSAFREDDYAGFTEIKTIYDRFRQAGKAKDIIGEMLGLMIDQNGEPVGGEVRQACDEAFSQIDFEILKDICVRGRVWLVAAMGYKAKAVLSALRKGWVNSLVIDNTIANYIISEEQKARER